MKTQLIDASIAAKTLAVLWAVLSFTDLALTYAALSLEGAEEANIFARWLIDESPLLAYGLKALVSCLICIGFWILAARGRHLVAIIASEALIIVYMIMVVSINARVLATIRY